jgi:Zn-dependent proteases
MQSSLKIGSIMDIPIKLDTSFVLALPISAYFFAINSQPYGFAEVEPPIVRYAFSALSAIFLFASVLLHELAHSYLAKRYGANIASITLLLFGGVASMEIPQKPGQEAKIAFAGPLTSLIIGIVCLFIYGRLISSSPAISQNSIYLIIWIIGSMNLLLGIFNLLPAFPMDGGRILRSFFARKMSYVKATHSAASIGKFVAILMAIYGIYVGDLWLLLIALYIYGSASNEDRFYSELGRSV